MPGTRKLGKPTDQRKAMLRAMVTYLLETGRIKTTVTRAKEVAPLAEKMITLGKHQTLADYRQALYLLFIEDMTCEEAAQVMRKTKKQVYNLSFRGRQSLKEILERRGIADAQLG